MKRIAAMFTFWGVLGCLIPGASAKNYSYTLTLGRAVILPVKKNGKAWDFAWSKNASYPDVLIYFELAGQRLTTPIRKDTLRPSWSISRTFQGHPQDAFYIRVVDKDIHGEDVIGEYKQFLFQFPLNKRIILSFDHVFELELKISGPVVRWPPPVRKRTSPPLPRRLPLVAPPSGILEPSPSPQKRSHPSIRRPASVRGARPPRQLPGLRGRLVPPPVIPTRRGSPKRPTSPPRRRASRVPSMPFELPFLPGITLPEARRPPQKVTPPKKPAGRPLPPGKRAVSRGIEPWMPGFVLGSPVAVAPGKQPKAPRSETPKRRDIPRPFPRTSGCPQTHLHLAKMEHGAWMAAIRTTVEEEGQGKMKRGLEGVRLRGILRAFSGRWGRTRRQLVSGVLCYVRKSVLGQIGCFVQEVRFSRARPDGVDWQDWEMNRIGKVRSISCEGVVGSVVRPPQYTALMEGMRELKRRVREAQKVGSCPPSLPRYKAPFLAQVKGAMLASDAVVLGRGHVKLRCVGVPGRIFSHREGGGRVLVQRTKVFVQVARLKKSCEGRVLWLKRARADGGRWTVWSVGSVVARKTVPCH